MSARLKATERAQRKFARLVARGARPQVLERQRDRVLARAFTVIERDKRIAKLERAAADAGQPLSVLPPRPTAEELTTARRAVVDVRTAWAASAWRKVG